ncbi:hypothetical protein P154DRAFT_50 [Amniculicola lignicola CBS 123094]|uniref:Uncharacterized protein n=1 Tax=Amniculicola lignicola CBS 123094 TaxID=1392246 RepID=A0A6A5X3W6_9PLEO|nr:hypothetical protein P154DRAFT_50 [Amniculicola lignicola CBS 123094]
MESHRASAHGSPDRSTSTAIARSSTEVVDLSSDTQPSTDQALQEAEGMSVLHGQASQPAMVSEHRPYQNLMKTSIIIEYGDGFEEHHKVPLEQLTKYSPRLRDLFASAMQLKESYQQARMLRQMVKRLLPRAISFERLNNRYIATAVPLVVQCHTQYPMLQYQQIFKDKVEKLVDFQFKRKDAFRQPESHAQARKDNCSLSDVRARLQYLSGVAIQEILNELHNSMWRVKEKETRSLRDDSKKAAAHDKIILYGYDAVAVGSLVSWIVNRRLHYETVDELFQLYELADTLGFEDLANTTLNKLSYDVTEAINFAQAHGIALLDVLDSTNSTPGKYADKVQKDMQSLLLTVFKHVFVLKKHSGPLRALLVNAVVDSQDLKLYDYLQPEVDVDLAHEINRAFFLRGNQQARSDCFRSRSHESLFIDDSTPDDGPQAGTGLVLYQSHSAH